MRRKRALQERETRRFGEAKHDGQAKGKFDEMDKITTRLVDRSDH
jgi:hypothetical protein